MRVSLPALALLLVLSPAELWGRTSTVYGGLSSAAYLFTGAQNENIFHQGAAHDAHFRIGGLLGAEHARPWYEARAGLFAGALLAAVAEGFRMPVAALDSAAVLRATRRVTLSASLSGTIEPLTSSRLRSTTVTSTVGKPAILYNPAIELELSFSPRSRASLTARANAMYLLSDHLEVHGDDLAAATGVEAELYFEHSLGTGKLIEAHALGRLMGAKARTNPPLTFLLGGLVGGVYEHHRLRVHAAAGVARVVGLPSSHLWPIEPLVDLELAYASRRDRLSLGAAWLVRENAYIGGLPSRFVALRGGYTQAPSERRLRTVAELSYELNRYGVARITKGERDADTMHTLRARGRAYLRVLGALRLFAEAEAAAGFVNLAQPTACAPNRCAEKGLLFRALFGVALLLSERPRDEALLTEVW